MFYFWPPFEVEFSPPFNIQIKYWWGRDWSPRLPGVEAGAAAGLDRVSSVDHLAALLLEVPQRVQLLVVNITWRHITLYCGNNVANCPLLPGKLSPRCLLEGTPSSVTAAASSPLCEARRLDPPPPPSPALKLSSDPGDTAAPAPS